MPFAQTLTDVKIQCGCWLIKKSFVSLANAETVVHIAVHSLQLRWVHGIGSQKKISNVRPKILLATFHISVQFFDMKRSPQIPHALLTNGVVQNPNWNHGNHMALFFCIFLINDQLKLISLPVHKILNLHLILMFRLLMLDFTLNQISR